MYNLPKQFTLVLPKNNIKNTKNMEHLKYIISKNSS